jgi:hypothetical protein
VSLSWALIVLVAKLTYAIPVPGYTATMLAITFFGALNCFGLGVIGEYVWRAFENTKGRPNFIVASRYTFTGSVDTAAQKEPGQASPEGPET